MRWPEASSRKSSQRESHRSRYFWHTKARSAWMMRSCFRSLQLAKSLGVIVTAHCENADAVALQADRNCWPRERPGPEWHEPSRPESVEALGVHHLMTFAAMHGTHCYIVHTSCEPAVRAGAGSADARDESLDRNADSIFDAGQNARGIARF